MENTPVQLEYTSVMLNWCVWTERECNKTKVARVWFVSKLWGLQIQLLFIVCAYKACQVCGYAHLLSLKLCPDRKTFCSFLLWLIPGSNTKTNR